jgi:hypothetical protein
MAIVMATVADPDLHQEQQDGSEAVDLGGQQRDVDGPAERPIVFSEPSRATRDSGRRS